MKKKIKKIITTTIISAVSLTAIGCGANNSNLAKNIDKSMEEFVSSINNLDYVETTSAKAPTSGRIGKIVETSANDNLSNNFKSTNNVQFLNNAISEAEIENTITIPSQRNDNFNLFVLSSTPYVTFTSDDNNMLNINVKFSTNQIQETSNEIESKINSLIVKRSILMIYVNEIYNGNVTISNEDKLAINAYVNVIKENTSYLNGNRGMVRNQLNLASDLLTSETNDNLINYYIIKSGEALETRASKLDSAISAIDSIIKIIENNLTTSSTYYQTNLSGTYNNLISNLQNTSEDTELTENSTNQEIANKIACGLNFCNTQEINKSKNSLIQNKQTTNQTPNNQNLTNSNNNTNQSNTINSNTTNSISTPSSQNNIENQINKNIQTENNIQRNYNNLTNENLPNTNETQDATLTNRNRNIIRRRTPKSIRNRTRNNQNSRSNVMNNDSNRINQNSQISTKEEYSNTQTSNNYENRASRVPYKSTSTFEQ